MALTNVPAEVIGSQILILNSGRLQISRHISNVVLVKKTTMHLDFSLFTFHSSLKHALRLHMTLTPSQLRW